MATVTVDSTSQRYTSRVAQEPDILLLHTTEGMSWPGYNGGATAPHDTIRAIPGKGIEVRRHYPYDQFSKSLENDAGGVETNKRGVIQVELRGTCDPKHRGDPAWYFWPDADDAVLEALADYYRPIMAAHDIPARAMAEFVAYPKSYGATPTRLTFAEWMKGSGICGHQHAPENAHGDPGAFPVARFIRFLTGTTPTAPAAKDWFDMATQADLEKALANVLMNNAEVKTEIARFVWEGYPIGPAGGKKVGAGWLTLLDQLARIQIDAANDDLTPEQIKQALTEAVASSVKVTGSLELTPKEMQ